MKGLISSCAESAMYVSRFSGAGIEAARGYAPRKLDRASHTRAKPGILFQ